MNGMKRMPSSKCTVGGTCTASANGATCKFTHDENEKELLRIEKGARFARRM